MKLLNIMLVSSIFFQSMLGVAQNPHAESGFKKVIVQEVLQVSSYTYLSVLEEGMKKWIAVPTMKADLGEIYYYKGGVEMPNFKSDELARTFDAMVFLSSITHADTLNVTKRINESKDESKSVITEPVKPAKQATLDKLELSIERVEGGIRIAELFENKHSYAGKRIKIKGEVTKFTGSIMMRNWVHFQDGTSFEGSYDLMVTCQENLIVGDVVIFEGIITLDKDIGAGYFYDVIMEDAVVVR